MGYGVLWANTVGKAAADYRLEKIKNVKAYCNVEIEGFCRRKREK